MSFKQLLAVISLSFFAWFMGACAQIQPTQTGYLSDYRRIDAEPAANSSATSVRMADVEAFYIEDISWKVPAENGFDEAQRAAVLTSLRESLAAELARIRPIVSHRESRTARVRVAVTDAKRANPLINILTTAAIFVPVANGGAALEGELLGPDGSQRLALTSADTGSLANFFGFFVEKSHAMTAAESFAREFAAKLNDEVEHDRSMR